MPTKFTGPAAQETKALAIALKKRGVKEEKLPAFLRDGVVAKSRKDGLGQLALRNISGMVPNPAQRVVARFEESAGGRDNIIEKLEAVGDQLRDPERALLESLQTSDKKKSLGRLIAESGASAMRIMKLFVEGTRILGESEALIMVGANQPSLVKELIRDALGERLSCQVCVGTGLVKAKKGDVEDTQECPACKGKGQHLLESAHKEFAMETLIKMTKLIPKEKGTLVNVQQNVGVQVRGPGGESAFMERLVKTSDEILYNNRKTILDAEVVEPTEEADPS